MKLLQITHHIIIFLFVNVLNNNIKYKPIHLGSHGITIVLFLFNNELNGLKKLSGPIFTDFSQVTFISDASLNISLMLGLRTHSKSNCIFSDNILKNSDR